MPKSGENKHTQGKYFIHQPEAWESKDLQEIEDNLDKKFEKSREAAVGEGAGGAGFDTVVEFLFTNPITTGLISTAVFEVAKLLWKKRPKHRPQVPKSIPATYRLVIHYNGTIIGINLDSGISEIEVALDKLPNTLESDASCVYQNGEDWDVY